MTENPHMDVHVDPHAVVAVLRRRIDELTYENAVLAVAVDQLQTRLNELSRHQATEQWPSR
ncbi:hypothetical protein [Nonomuraea sp. 10N515B]|uniref:hypothetical protein n=1 Tax=Nonomuraea sp. 10N515B TaxID=3457422 RepID=UPI003FCD1D3A